MISSSFPPKKTGLSLGNLTGLPIRVLFFGGIVLVMAGMFGHILKSL